MNQLLIYLLAMVIVVPVAKRLGLGSVLGYLIAGALIGPDVLNLLGADHERTSSVGEFGVIMMLLLIGLELNPKLLWKMRGPILGFGSVQVAVTSAAFAAVAIFAFHLPWEVAVTIGLILSASSTAIAIQTLQDDGYAKTVGGERAFSVLLFQDIAVIPILALLPVLASRLGVANVDAPKHSGLLIIGSVAAVVLAGRFVIQPLFRIIARLKLRDTFTVLALLIVLGATALMEHAGLSPALGAFLAGVVLADSEFRHQIEATIEPFKGLLLGLFFLTVGASIRFSVIAEQPLLVASCVLGIIALKGAIAYGIGRVFRTAPPASLLFAAALAQGGEFAFVLIGQAGGLLSHELGQILVASVAVSMAFAPLLISFTINHGMGMLSKFVSIPTPAREPDVVDERERQNPVLVIGIGRFGQTLIRFLRANGIASTVLDIDSEQIDIMARFGIKSYFGDGSNLDLLQAAGLTNARALVIAIDEPETTIRIVEDVRRDFPNLPIFARAYDRIHAYRLIHLGVTEIAIETSGSALGLGIEVLEALGVDEATAYRKAQAFRVNNEHSIRLLAKKFHEVDRETFIQTSRQLSEQLEAMLQIDPEELAKNGVREASLPS